MTRTLFALTGVVLMSAPAPAADPAPAGVLESNRRFAAELYRKVAAEGENALVSPYSVHSALLLVHAGAGGDTLAEIDRVLRLAGPDSAAGSYARLADQLSAAGPKGTPSMSVANAIWAAKGLAPRDGYLARVRDGYGAEARELDFAGDADGSRRTINGWVSERTRERIPELLPAGSIDSLVRVVLTNAVAFKADWKVPFEKRATKPAPFHLADGSKKDVPMMRRVGGLRLGTVEGGRVLELPYADPNFVMAVVLPDEGADLSAFEKGWSADALSVALANARMANVDVGLPRFTLKIASELKPTLAAMGLQETFGSSPDLSAMTPARDIVLSRVIHEAFIQVDEVGTEAAAATAIIGRAKSAAPRPPERFVCDRPFVFAVVHKPTGLPAFVGRFAKP